MSLTVSLPHNVAAVCIRSLGSKEAAENYLIIWWGLWVVVKR